MALGRLAGLHPQVLEHARLTIAWWEHLGGPPIRVTSGYRSMQEQERLRNLYLAGQSPWPANAPGDSAHNWGLAWDASDLPAAWAPSWAAFREYFGWRVPPNDRIHAEVPGWRSLVGR